MMEKNLCMMHCHIAGAIAQTDGIRSRFNGWRNIALSQLALFAQFVMGVVPGS
jgi:hypothetical protein